MTTRTTLLLIATCVLACSSLPTLPRPDVAPFDPPDDDVFRVGVATVDITPPPGLSLFGHGPEGRISVGWRTRLECQVFVITQGSEVVALVPCDLAAVSMLLQRTVAAKLAEDRVPIGANRLLLMATHTHAGPAHYFGSGSYSGAFSSRAHGYDAEVKEWLAHRIAAAIGDAWRARAPAKITWHRSCVNGLTRNRSFDAFLANENLSDRLAQVQDVGLRTAVEVEPGRSAAEPAPASAVPENAGLPAEGEVTAAAPDAGTQPGADTDSGAVVPDAGAPPDGGAGASGSGAADSARARAMACMTADPEHPGDAVDPTLTVFDFHTEQGERLGVFAVFGMHQTAAPNTSDVYHGDVFGYARRAVAERLESGGDTGRSTAPVIGIANGIEGDVSPAWREQSHWEARRIGFSLAAEIASELAGAPEGAVEGERLRVAYRELELPNRRAGEEGRLCRRPELGAAAAGGAEDGPTAFRIISAFNEGATAESRCSTEQACGCHGRKLTLVPPGGRADASGADFPARVPISIFRLGGLVVASVPAEMTTVAGDRALRAVRDELLDDGPGVDHVALTGLTNAYLQYVTTEEEYELQQYEGASTLYGRWSSRFFSNQLACLARYVRAEGHPAPCFSDQPRVDAVTQIRYGGSPEVSRMPPPFDARDQDFNVRVRLEPIREHGHEGWEIAWLGEEPGFLRNPENLRVSVLRCDDDTCGGDPVDDDRGVNTEVRYEWDDRNGGTRWKARWFPDFGRDAEEWCRRYQFRVVSSTELRSEPFVASQERCSASRGRR